jgi:hypothetical protein
MTHNTTCADVSVVEIVLGASDLGLGMAGGVPGMILGDLGARVTWLGAVRGIATNS